MRLITRHSLAAALGVTLAQAARCQRIKWGDCPDLEPGDPSLRILCGSLTVPLDYTDTSSNRTLRIELVKVPATQRPSKGSILLNFGGPGSTGRDSLAAGAAQLLALSGGHHDLVAFDPRGTGNTLPFSCYPDASASLRVTNALMARDTSKSSDAAAGTLWGMAQVVADACNTSAQETGGLIGTAFVVRDMMRIVDALGEDGMLRYWGFSYGSVLGATAAAMFPDRIDRMILDGAVNPHDYYNGWDLSWVTDTDKVLAAFFEKCVENPKTCALAVSNLNSTAAELEATVFEYLETQLKYNPFPVAGFLIEYSTIKKLMLSSLYNPAQWPILAAGLQALLSHDTAALAGVVQLASRLTTSTSDPQVGIRCGDKSVRSPSLNDFRPIMDQQHATSKLGDCLTSGLMQCAQWNMAAKERHTGDFSANTRHPALVIGNTFDPVTPLASAHNVSAGLQGSVVLQHNGYGHTSTVQPSICTAKVIQTYLVNGTLPAPGTVCEPSVPVFAPPVLATRDIKEEDGKLLEAVRKLGDLVGCLPY